VTERYLCVAQCRYVDSVGTVLEPTRMACVQHAERYAVCVVACESLCCVVTQPVVFLCWSLLSEFVQKTIAVSVCSVHMVQVCRIVCGLVKQHICTVLD